MSWRKFLILPRLIALSARAPRDQGKAWDLFWSRVRRSGPGGDVLWDLGSDAEIGATLERLRAHLDLSLPIVDVGAGSGRLTRALAGCFPRAIGVDVSAAAIARARDESRGVAGVEFRVVDMSRPGAGKALADELGPMNAHIRGVLHVMSPEAQAAAIENIRAVLGDKGALYVIETDFHGDPLDHLEFQGATAGAIPEPLRLLIASGVRAPAHFSEREVDALFPRARWERVACGPAVLHTLPMHNRDGGTMDELSAYYAILRPAGCSWVSRGTLLPLDIRTPSAYSPLMSAEPTAAEPVVPPFDPVPLLSEELSLPRAGVAATVKLLAEGATVPFIARYRKEATGGLDEVQIRAIEERRAYVLELDERRRAVVAEIHKQGKLTDALFKKILTVATKAELEDLYLPFKPKRRTRAIIARERGLEPLADRIWAQPMDGDPEGEARAFVDAAKEVPDTAAALAGARDICAERVAEDADVRKLTREAYQREGVIKVVKNEEHAQKATKFDMYATFEEPVHAIPSHRYLAIRRGEAEGVLRASIDLDAEHLLPSVRAKVKLAPRSPWAGELEKAVADATRRLLLPTVQSDVRVDLKMQADRNAVEVFAQNLRQLLLAAPFGTRMVLGIDPGQRTGCKCAVVDDTGKLLEHQTFYLVQGAEATERARQTLRAICKKYPLRAIAVGNGTHGRETEAFVKDVLAAEGLREVFAVPVSEAGASVYSASDVAREEFPDLDLTVRGAVSIARRLQDPLAELVKIDPKSIGVGQYQHDVYQGLLARKLDEVIESCVNLVGVELNTASAPLLSRVAGIGPALAKKIVAHRNDKGAFKSRKALHDVAGVGPKTFEQAAGFLRVRGGDHPLDASAVHPERYPLVEKMAADLGVPVASLVGDLKAIDRIDPRRYVEGDVGLFTLNDILAELKKPGRDPRAGFEPPKFRDDVRELSDLSPGMELEGVVTNVTAFGAFVDVGVHQDGLVHVSQLADRFVKDPAEVVKVGDKLKVRVLEVDLDRKRIALSAKKGGGAFATATRPHDGGGARPQQGQARPQQGQGRPQQGRGPQQGQGPKEKQGEGFRNNPFANLLRKGSQPS